MQRAYVYKLKPTRAQAAAMARQLELHRLLYNAALEHRRTAWDRAMARFRLAGGGYVTSVEAHQVRTQVLTDTSYAAQNRDVTRLRHDDPDYALMSTAAEQRTLRRLDRAFMGFFRRARAGQNPGYPRYKGRGRLRSIQFTAGNGASLRGNRASFQGIGAVKLDLYRPIPATAVVKALTFKWRASGWWLACSVELPDEAVLPASGPAVGLSLGPEHFAALSDGTIIEHPRFGEVARRRLRVAARKVSRRKRASNRRRKAARLLARQHERVAERRKQFHYRMAGRLMRDGGYGGVVAPKLDVPGSMQTRDAETRPPAVARRQHRDVLDAGWASFLAIVRRRAEEAGVAWREIDSSGTAERCSRCGAVGLEVAPDLLFRCPECGLVLDLEINAARTILAHAQQ